MSAAIMGSQFFRLISILLLTVFAVGFLNPILSFWPHQDAHHTDCLEFGHIHIGTEEECHGGLLVSAVFLPNQIPDFTEILLTSRPVYLPSLNTIYQAPTLMKFLRPPRYS